jgi:hypothetical protein
MNCLDCLELLIEDIRDNTENIKKDSQNNFSKNDPLNDLVPQLIEFTKESYPALVQAKSLTCINLCLFNMPQILKQNIYEYIEVLLKKTQIIVQ